MKKRFIKVLVFFVLSFFISRLVYADTSIHLTIKTPNTTLYNQDILVSPCDSEKTGVMKVTPYCAILQSGISSDWNWSWAPSAFLNSLSGVAGYTSKDKDNNDVYHFWGWSLNGAEAWDALNQYELQAGDLISLDFIDPGNPASVVLGGQGLVEEKDKPKISNSNTVPSSGINSSNNQIFFDKNKAIKFLISQQKDDGSFGGDILTDWAGVALASGQDSKSIINLVKYLSNSKINDPSLTDVERRTMALMSLGLSPYNTYKENYINKILNSFDGKQFGDKDEDNDDIFALIVLKNVGYSKEENLISKDLDFILGRQNTNGSWDNSVDMTGVGMLALSNFVEKNSVLSDVKSVLIQESLSKARNFLKKEQKPDGGFGNVSSTAWAIEGMLALGENPSDWTIGNNSNSVILKTPLDYLTENQDIDGGIKNENLQNKIWETAYVLSALSQKTWNETMQVFPKEKIVKRASLNITAEQNLANTLSALSNTSPDLHKEETKKSWARRFLNFLLAF